MVAIQRQHWRDASIERSEAITDAWEVTKVYAGRLAEWVLFLCMVANIIEILPGVEVWEPVANTILGIQAVTLDIAGFGLATMAEQARLCGEEKAASRARTTAYLLIGLMMVTVLSLSIGTLWHSMKGYTDIADKLLILIRVVMTVVYGHVLHSLRQHTVNVVPASMIEERLNLLTERVSQLHLRYEPVNYERITAQIVPLLPQPERPNYEAMMTDVLTELSHLQAQKEQAVSEALVALQATVAQLSVERVPVEPSLEPIDKWNQNQTSGTVARPVLSVVPVERGTGNEVTSFIGTFMEREGRVPTLAEIMDGTGCSKSTASRNRSNVLKEQTA